MKIIVGSHKEKEFLLQEAQYIHARLSMLPNEQATYIGKLQQLWFNPDLIEVHHTGETFRVKTKEDDPEDEYFHAGSTIHVYEEYEGKYYGFHTSSFGTYSLVIPVEKCVRINESNSSNK